MPQRIKLHRRATISLRLSLVLRTKPQLDGARKPVALGAAGLSSGSFAPSTIHGDARVHTGLCSLCFGEVFSCGRAAGDALHPGADCRRPSWTKVQLRHPDGGVRFLPGRPTRRFSSSTLAPAVSGSWSSRPGARSESPYRPGVSVAASAGRARDKSGSVTRANELVVEAAFSRPPGSCPLQAPVPRHVPGAAGSVFRHP